MVKIKSITFLQKVYEVIIDNGEVLTIDPKTKEEFFLYVGKELTAQDIRAIKQFENILKPYQYTLRLLTRGAYTTKMIKDKLVLRKVDDDVIYSVLEKLKTLGLVNDAEYAKERINFLINTKNAAKRAIINDLRKKGISDEVTQRLLAEYPAFEIEHIEKLVPKLLKRYQKLSLYKAKEKLMTKLYTDGFTRDNISSALHDFDYSEYINEDENLENDFNKLLNRRLKAGEDKRDMVYNKLTKAGYPKAKIRIIIERLNDEN